MPNKYLDFECLSNAKAPSEANSFKQLCYELNEQERKVIQRQIDSRVADIIRLTREVQLITHCPHTAIASEPSFSVFRLRCKHCRAWLE